MNNCYFYRQDGECSLLEEMICSGWNKDCGFYKTEEQFIREQDRAIEVNRARGNCLTCKYDCAPCKLSKERKHG